MKKAPPVKLSLRKLMLAMLAVGPVGILPAPLWAAVPATTPFTVQNGSAAWSASGTTGTINITANRSVLVWGQTAGATNFNIAPGETYNFSFDNITNGAVLNKVSAGTATIAGDNNVAAYIGGSLISNGRVFVLSTSGNIIMAPQTGSTISTGGLVLSTLSEDALNFSFTSQGLLENNPNATSNGRIVLGGGAANTSVLGNLSATSHNISVNGLQVTGDLVLNQIGANATLPSTLALTSAAATSVTNNLTVTTNNTSITQGAGALTVGNLATLTSGTGDITLTVANGTSVASAVTITNGGTGYTAAPTVTVTGAGRGATATATIDTNGVVTGVTIGGSGGVGYTTAPALSFSGGGGTGAAATATVVPQNDFNHVRVNTTGSVVLGDANNVTVGNATGNSTAGNLTVTAVGNITTGGLIAVANNVTLNSTIAGNVTFASNSTVGNTLVASAFNGNITVNTPGNLTTGALTTNTAARDVSLTVGNVLTFNGTVTTTGNVIATAASINSTTAGLIGSGTTSATRAAAVTLNATGANSNIVLPAINANSLVVQTAGGSVTGSNVLNINGTGGVTINATPTGSVTLNANNVFGSAVPLNIVGNSVTINAANDVVFSNLDAAGSVTVNTSASNFAAGNVTFGVGGGSNASTIRIGGNLAVSTNGSNVGDDPQANETIFGSITVNTMAAGYGQLANNATVTGGSGFLRNPSIVITGNAASGSNATATATTNTTTGVVTGVSITNGGGGFNTAPTIAFVGGGTPTSAAATGAVATFGTAGNLSVSDIPVTNTGGGFTAPPTVVIAPSHSGGTNATATAIVDTTNGTLLSINITNPGNGYTAAPTVTLIGGGGNTATATTGGMVAPTVATSIIPRGNVTFNAAVNQGNGTYGQFIINAAADVNIGERTTVNLGTINASSVTARSLSGDILINGAQTIYNNGGWSGRANAGNITQVSGAINAGTGTVTANINGSTGSVNLTNSSNVFGTLSYNSSSSAQGNILVASSVNVDRAAVTGTSNLTVSTTGTGSNITVTAGNFNGTATFNAAGNVILTSNNATNSLNARNLVLISADTSANSITQQAAVTDNARVRAQYNGLAVNGTMTLSTPGGVTLNHTNNESLGNVVLSNLTNATATVALATRGNIAMVSGNAAGTVNLTSGTVGQNSVPIASTITLGNLNVGNLVASAQNGGVGSANLSSTPFEAANLPNNGASGDIRQATNSSLHVENILTAVTFNGGNIVLGNNGNSAGRVQLSTAGALPVGTVTGSTAAAAAAGTAPGTFTLATANSGGNITFTEDGTVRLGALQTASNATITSRFGSIIEDSNAAVVLNVGGTLALNAAAGSIGLGNLSRAAGTGTFTSNAAALSANTQGSLSLTSTSNLTLGNIQANSLSVTAANITQSSPLNIFGSSSFTSTADAGNITLTNAANNFGPVTLIAARNATVSLTENATLNLRTVTMGLQGAAGVAAAAGNGTLTLTSANGDIMDSGLGGVKLGGLVAPVGVPNAGAVLAGSGAVSLVATNGNIVINDTTSDVLTSAGVAFNANNVTLSVLGSTGSTLVLGTNTTASVANGNLTVASALGNIGNAGAIRVGGVASFQTANGNITIDQPNVGFGQLQFNASGAAGAGRVQITESGSMDILTGSSASGQSQLIAGGSLTIVPGTGVVTFGNNVALQSTGDMTLRQMQVVGNLTISHTGTANLSALSNSADLNGRWVDTNDLGTGPGPKTDPSLAPRQ